MRCLESCWWLLCVSRARVGSSRYARCLRGKLDSSQLSRLSFFLGGFAEIAWQRFSQSLEHAHKVIFNRFRQTPPPCKDHSKLILLYRSFRTSALHARASEPRSNSCSITVIFMHLFISIESSLVSFEHRLLRDELKAFTL